MLFNITNHIPNSNHYLPAILQGLLGQSTVVSINPANGHLQLTYPVDVDVATAILEHCDLSDCLDASERRIISLVQDCKDVASVDSNIANYEVDLIFINIPIISSKFYLLKCIHIYSHLFIFIM